MDVAKPIFAFETDFAGTLRCIPMCVRYQLDRIGIKLTLRQWSLFTSEERHQLVEFERDEPEVQTALTERLTDLMLSHGGGDLDRVPAVSGAEWSDGGSIPARVISYAKGLDIAPPSPARWATLSPLQRFALFKLTRPNHDNDNFIPAMREFGLLD